MLGIGENRTYLFDYYKAKTVEEKTRVINDYAMTQLGMTADIDIDDDVTKQIDTSQSSNTALRIRFSECTDPTNDIKSLAQDCMCHKCNGYCLVQGRNQDQARECRCGFGIETAFGEKDTEGKPLRNVPLVIQNKKGVSMLEMKRTNSRRVNQLSVPMLRAWRANCDIQLLLYNTNPLYPDITEIESVTRYVVAYTSKKSLVAFVPVPLPFLEAGFRDMSHVPGTCPRCVSPFVPWDMPICPLRFGDKWGGTYGLGTNGDKFLLSVMHGKCFCRVLLMLLGVLHVYWC